MKKSLLVVFILLLSACGVRDTDPYGLSGEWHRSEKETIVIQGRHGKAVAQNKAEIPIELEYQMGGEVRILEKNQTPDYLENFIPRLVAENIYTNQFVRETYFLIRKIEDNRLEIMVHGWQVFYSIENQIYYVVPHLKDEVWTRIKK